MPHRKKKKFIDKKNALTFHLVHRSQKDPLQASEDVGQHVLLPVADKEVEKRKEEERKYGVFFDDDYDYLKHLKDVNEVYQVEPDDNYRLSKDTEKEVEDEHKVQLPSTVFASSMETDVGLLNKAAPVSGPLLDWDPDIVAGLDEDFDFDNPDNLLEDDFILKANTEVGEDIDEENDEWTDDDEEDVESCEGQFSDAEMEDNEMEESFEKEETRSRFTAYSMTSSVIRRTEGLTLLDDRFEKMFEEYDDCEIGALDNDDIDGSVDPSSKVLNKALEEFEKHRKKVFLTDIMESKSDDEEDPACDREDTEEYVKVVVDDRRDKWDCESILSTYSNLYNHPTLITEPSNNRKNNKRIELTTRIGIPMDGLEKPGLTRKQIEKDLYESQRADRASTYRPKDETPEEKKQRKQAIKEERKERRQEKKANKMAFGEEKMRQKKEHLNIRNNLQGVKML